jgi:hypothetical protein
VGLINNTPRDVIFIIALQLQLHELLPLTQTSKIFWHLFHYKLPERNPLLYVMKADERGTDNSLMKLKAHDTHNWECVLKKMPSKEPCGRNWKSVSPLEYAAWIGDTFMVTMLLDHVPTEGLQQALDQLRAVKDYGLEHGPHMAPFYALINAYNHYITHFSQFNNWYERKIYCIKTIGVLQRCLSSFGLQWFCDDGFLASDQAFNRAPRRAFILIDELWDDPCNSTLGLYHWLYKYSWEGRGVRAARWMCDLRDDAVKITDNFIRLPQMLETLCQVSSNQLDLIITSLEQRIAATKSPRLK